MLVLKPYLHVSMEEVREVYVSTWVSYVPKGVTPGNVSSWIPLTLSIYYISHIAAPYIYTPTTIIPIFKPPFFLIISHLVLFHCLLLVISLIFLRWRYFLTSENIFKRNISNTSSAQMSLCLYLPTLLVIKYSFVTISYNIISWCFRMIYSV